MKRMSTDEFLTVHAPEIPPSWFKKVRERLRLFLGVNGGDVELCTRFKGGKDQWNKWEMIDPGVRDEKHP